MPRVAGCDPGTSSLDLLTLTDGAVAEQVRFPGDELRADPAAPVRWLRDRGPFDLIAGPSGYGLPLVRAADGTERHLDLMTLVRRDERGRDGGVLGFRRLLRELCAANLPVVFLPGVVHLPTVPPWRKLNRIDLGTADKLCAAALALADDPAPDGVCVVELGSAFSAAVVAVDGRVVDGVGGTSGPPGWQGGGAWDGEAAYLLSPLSKGDLFAGGAAAVPDAETGRAWCRAALVKAVAGLMVTTPFARILTSGRLREHQPELVAAAEADLGRLAPVAAVRPLPGAWVKESAQGAALLADGLA